MNLNKIITAGIQFIVFINISLFTQWQTDLRQTNDPAVSFTCLNNAWAIAPNENALHIVWMDNRMGNFEIYYKRSTDEGINWGIDTRLTSNASSKLSPCISNSDSKQHIVWMDNRDGNYEIYYMRSTNNGLNWENETRLTNNTYLSENPSIIASSSNVYVVWDDNRNGNNEVFFKRSTDSGMSWGPDTRISNNLPEEAENPSISVMGQILHVVWYGYFINYGHSNIFYRRSNDGGATWQDDAVISSINADARNPCISASGQNVQVTWMDHRDGNSEIYWMATNNGGLNWNSEVRLTNDTAFSEKPSISVSGQNSNIVWYDTRDGNAEIYWKRSTNTGVSWQPDTRLTNSPGISQGASISSSGQTTNIVWHDNRDGNYEIYYKRNPTGNLTGLQNFGNEIPKDYLLSQNYPNPFNPTTTIKFAIPKSGNVNLKVYDIIGREVRTIIDNMQINAGTVTHSFDGTELASGIYFYSLFVDGNLIETKKMVLVK